ncbi:MAG: ribonuclease Z [Methanomassiliicoccales archaeon]
MRIIFLGTAGSLPTPQRNPIAVAVQMGPDILLFDCGEGTQRQFMLSSASFMRVTDIFISHFHGDHFLGLPGLIQSMNFFGRKRELRIFGPAGIKEALDLALSLSFFQPSFDVSAFELVHNQCIHFSGYDVKAIQADHTIPAFSYVLEEEPRPGKFNVKKARDLGVPEGPAFRALQEGKTVSVGDLTISPSMVIGPKRRGRKISISGDTRPNLKFIEASKNADLMIHEATLSSDLEDEANEYGHSTAQQAGKVAAQAKAKMLYLYHFSNRYDDVKSLVNEAKKEFPIVFAAEDLLSLQINPPEEEWNRSVFN